VNHAIATSPPAVRPSLAVSIIAALATIGSAFTIGARGATCAARLLR